MKYMFNTVFQQLDINNSVIGCLDLRTNLETEGAFEGCGTNIYKNILNTLLECLEEYEGEVDIYGR